MPRDADEYKEWQAQYEDLEQEWNEEHEGWSNEDKARHLENMRLYNKLEQNGREEVRKEWGDDGNDGHDDRIEKLRDQHQLLGHSIEHAKGRYTYQTARMQDVDEDLREQLERENDKGGNDERWAKFYGGKGGVLGDEQEGGRDEEEKEEDEDDEDDEDDEEEDESENEDGEEETSDMDIESDSDSD